jgi:hypothetical protein
MFSPNHHTSPPRCVYDGSAIALSAQPATPFPRYTSVNSASATGDVDGIIGFNSTRELPVCNIRICYPGYVNHPTYGWLPASTPYLARLAERMVS